MKAHLRVARPTDNLQAISEMYQHGLGLGVLSHFEDHEGFDGIMLGNPEMSYHFEFTHHRGHAAGKAPTQDNLLVFYIPNESQWERQCRKMTEAGFKLVASYNPYWDREGKTFEDLDGYRIVLQNSDW
jgi:catechol 2,3-dioxygenase-like lactoylglutathione lyase family enzyme